MQEQQTADEWVQVDRDISAHARTRAYQINLYRCVECGSAAVNARGEDIPVRPDVLERAECDAVIVDATQPSRACRTVPPKNMRMAKARAHGKCETPECRNRIWLQIHHRQLRSEGGTHSTDNLIVLCRPCHDAMHDGRLMVEGTRQTGLVFLHADGTHIGSIAADAERVDVFEQAYAVLRRSGMSDLDARRALEVLRKEAPNAPLEEIVHRAMGSVAREPASHVGPSCGCTETTPRYGMVH